MAARSEYKERMKKFLHFFQESIIQLHLQYQVPIECIYGKTKSALALDGDIK
jgi:hypothetical protein